jgi:hypothetical protein
MASRQQRKDGQTGRPKLHKQAKGGGGFRQEGQNQQVRQGNGGNMPSGDRQGRLKTGNEGMAIPATQLR